MSESDAHLDLQTVVKLAQIQADNLTQPHTAAVNTDVESGPKKVRKSVARVETIDPMREHEKRMKNFLKKFSNEPEDPSSRSNSLTGAQSVQVLPSGAVLTGSRSPRQSVKTPAGGLSPRKSVLPSLSAVARSTMDLRTPLSVPFGSQQSMRSLVKSASRSSVSYDSNWQEVGNYSEMMASTNKTEEAPKNPPELNTADLLKSVDAIRGTNDIQAALRMVAQLEAQLNATHAVLAGSPTTTGEGSTSTSISIDAGSTEDGAGSGPVMPNTVPSSEPPKPRLSQAIIDKYYGEDSSPRKVVAVKTVDIERAATSGLNPRKPVGSKRISVPAPAGGRRQG